VSIQCLYHVVHEFGWHQGIISEAEGLSQLDVCGASHTHLSDIRVPSVRPRHCLSPMCALCYTCVQATSGYHRVPLVKPRDCLNSSFALRSACIWATSGYKLYHEPGRGIVSTQCLYCVLHALGDSGVPYLRPMDCLNSLGALCFTCI